MATAPLLVGGATCLGGVVNLTAPIEVREGGEE